MPWPVSPPYYAAGICAVCERLFRFEPHRVPLVIALGERRPVCRGCMRRANRDRAQRGLPLLTIPAGAYEPDPS